MFKIGLAGKPGQSGAETATEAAWQRPSWGAAFGLRVCSCELRTALGLAIQETPVAEGERV